MGKPQLPCPECDKPIQETTDAIYCPECGRAYHKECWEKVGRRCVKLKCKGHTNYSLNPFRRVINKLFPQGPEGPYRVCRNHACQHEMWVFEQYCTECGTRVNYPVAHVSPRGGYVSWILAKKLYQYQLYVTGVLMVMLTLVLLASLQMLVRFGTNQYHKWAAALRDRRATATAVALRNQQATRTAVAVRSQQATSTATALRDRPATAPPTPTPRWMRQTNSTEDFSNVQGTNNWYYMASNGRDSRDFQEIPWDPKDDFWEWCYDPALGKAPCPERYVGWHADFGHPGMEADIAKVWVSPVSGPLKIVGSARKEHDGGDGVLVEIYHEHSSGRNKLWATTIRANDTSPKYFDDPMVIEAGKGDRLFFVLKIRGRPEWDKTFLDVTIYTSALAAAPTPTAKLASKPTRPPAITSYQNKIVFKSDREGGEALYVMNPDGSDQRRLDDESVYYKAFAMEAISPDGQWMLEVMEFDGNVDIYKIDVARTKSHQRITSDAAIDQEPVWAPIDWNRIAFVSDRMGNTDIWTQNVSEPLEEERLTDNPDYDKHPSWSPDGTQVVYWAVHGGGPRQIWVMKAADGSNKRNISNNKYNDWDPIWIKRP